MACVVMAVLGKGGVGKTVFSALAARALLDAGRQPLLLVDADPVGGLACILGADPEKTLGTVRERLIREATRPDVDRETMAQQIDWMVLEALQERGDYSLLCMGRPESKGCFCPVNTLLKRAVEKLSTGFDLAILDAEAGIEQVNRQTFNRVDIPVLITDPSFRGLRAADAIAGLLQRYDLNASRAGLVLNRAGELPGPVPDGLAFWGRVPDDPEVGRFDREGRSLLDLPEGNPALEAVRRALGDVGKIIKLI